MSRRSSARLPKLSKADARLPRSFSKSPHQSPRRKPLVRPRSEQPRPGITQSAADETFGNRNVMRNTTRHALSTLEARSKARSGHAYSCKLAKSSVGTGYTDDGLRIGISPDH